MDGETVLDMLPVLLGETCPDTLIEYVLLLVGETEKESE